MLTIQASSRRRSKGGLVTLGTVVGLIAAMALTLFGTGAADHTVASFDASSWLWSSRKGEVARVNGVTGRVDTRYKITDGRGHTMQVSQNDRYVILRDLNTGKISVLDLSSLQIGATTKSTPGLGITVAVHDNVAFVIDAVQGLVRQLDPATLIPLGEPLAFPPGILSGTFDSGGQLWLLVPTEGTVVAVKPSLSSPAAARRGGPAGKGGAALGAAGPSITKTIAVADPSHDLALSVLDGGVAVLDRTAATLTTIRGDDRRTVQLKMTGLGQVPPRTVGSDIPVTVADDRHVYVISGDAVTDFVVPGNGPKLQPCTAFSGRFYCADDATGTVYVFDRAGKRTNTISIASGGTLELEVREGRLFINAPDSSTARVVDEHHRVKVVNKYANNILGGDPPPKLPPPPPVKPPVGPPGPPAGVTASAGDKQARVTWRAAPANGSAILKYIIEGDGKAHQVGANQRTLDITGLTNGKEYRFSVHAVNGKGAGPRRTANPVVPTSDVPDPPTSVTAAATGDGKVTVTWPPANGQGRKIVRYEVTSISAGTQAPAGSAKTAKLVIGPGTLTYGTQYAFQVVSVNDIGASSTPSPVSNTVVPFTKPGPPKSLRVQTTSNQRGAVTADWQPADDNGRAITGYQVSAGGKTQTVGDGTSVTLGGFGDGATVNVTVAAVNEAGTGDEAGGTAQTVRAPTIDVTGASSAYRSITVNFSADDGGGSPATCTLSVSGAGNASGSCTGLTVNGLWPGNSYGYTVTIANAAGMTDTATGSQATPALQGTVLCNNSSYCGPNAPGGGIWVYSSPSQIEANAVNDTFAGDRFQSTCKVADSRGLTINATAYGGKKSNMWVGIKYRSGRTDYIPFAWFRLDGGDDLGLLPGC